MKNHLLCEGCIDELDCEIWVLMPDDLNYCPYRRVDGLALDRAERNASMVAIRPWTQGRC